jgi:hypothetical protein
MLENAITYEGNDKLEENPDSQDKKSSQCDTLQNDYEDWLPMHDNGIIYTAFLDGS